VKLQHFSAATAELDISSFAVYITTMIRYLYKTPNILFIGINPHQGSFSRGVPFSNNKMFWYLLSRAGLLEESVDQLRDDYNLKKMYREKFNAAYKLGFVNLIDRPTRDITLILKGEEEPGRKRASKIITKEKPPIICFVGKVSYEKFTGSKNFTFGWQDDIGASRAFVMHFPLRGKASVRIDELKEVAAAVKDHGRSHNKI